MPALSASTATGYRPYVGWRPRQSKPNRQRDRRRVCIHGLWQRGVGLVPERTRNQILSQLAVSDPDVFGRLMQQLEPHPLQRGVLLGNARAHMGHIYFLDSGIISLVAETRTGS